MTQRHRRGAQVADKPGSVYTMAVVADDLFITTKVASCALITCPFITLLLLCM